MSSQEISAGKGHIAYWANMMATVDGVITQMTCERASRLISPVAHPTGIHYGGGRRVADGILFMLSFWAWKAGWPKVKKKKKDGEVRMVGCGERIASMGANRANGKSDKVMLYSLLSCVYM